MGLLGCSHKWREHRHGQLVCSKCGQVKNGRTPRSSITHRHTWKGERGNPRRQHCTECTATRTV